MIIVRWAMALIGGAIVLAASMLAYIDLFFGLS